MTPLYITFANWTFDHCNFGNWTFGNWLNPMILICGDGIIPARAAKPRVHGIENSPRVTKGTSQFPTNGLAGVVKQKFPTSGAAASGEFLFYHNC